MSNTLISFDVGSFYFKKRNDWKWAKKDEVVSQKVNCNQGWNKSIPKRMRRLQYLCKNPNNFVKSQILCHIPLSQSNEKIFMALNTRIPEPGLNSYTLNSWTYCHTSVHFKCHTNKIMWYSKVGTKIALCGSRHHKKQKLSRKLTKSDTQWETK